MSTKELTCIGCPLGCQITVEFDDEKKQVVSVTGNSCKTGDIYARKEVTNPTRIVTSSIPVTGGDAVRVSCKTQHAIPEKAGDCTAMIGRTGCKCVISCNVNKAAACSSAAQCGHDSAKRV